ncbi:MAG: manganese efflux pump MntP family protein [Dehalococcoidia bacterium]|jgi:putative Mn2+ efflux pump MntP
MSFISILLIALALSMDAFSVATALGAAGRQHSRLAVLRLATAFGLFQFVMPILGWLLGRTVVSYIADYDHWIAFGLLAIVGIHMIKEYFDKDAKERLKDPTKGWPLLILSIATSIDALAVGVSFAFFDVNIYYAGAVIGIVCFAITAVGMVFGRALSRVLGKKAVLFGGIVLIAIGIKIVIEHMVE